MEKFSKENIVAKLSKIKKVLLEEAETESVELEDVRMVDGTILRIEPAIEVGATVQVIDENGELIDAPDGDHELEDGRVVRTEGAVIVELIEVEGEEVVEEEMSEEEVVKPKPALDIDALQNQLIQRLNDSISEKIEKLRFAKESEVAVLTEENRELRNTLIEVVEMFEAFSNAEVKEPKKKPYNPYAKKDTNFDFSKLLK